jgi:Na+/H+ antiporter NhaD/arsenite permease-like protein
MFILVEALQYTGWIRVFGGWWTAWADVAGVAGSIWLMGTLAVIGCNVSARPV